MKTSNLINKLKELDPLDKMDILLHEEEIPFLYIAPQNFYRDFYYILNKLREEYWIVQYFREDSKMFFLREEEQIELNSIQIKIVQESGFFLNLIDNTDYRKWVLFI
jgi:hypothetical protein